jgi:hypothetical protein
MPRDSVIIVCFVLLVALIGIAGLLQTADTDGGNGKRRPWRGRKSGDPGQRR